MTLKLQVKPLQTVVLGLACVVTLLPFSAHAESLFRSGISYQTNQAYTPRSLFAVPRPTNIGDMLTIQINQNTAVAFQNTTSLDQQKSIDDNGPGIYNNFIKRVLGISQALPSMNGLVKDNSSTLTAKTQKAFTYTDSVTVQVVQVLPNGNLVVQGKKTIMANNEQQDLLVSGIVNPYYINSTNIIASEKVADLQMSVSGRGMMSRPLSDGLSSKYMRFFN